MATILVSSGLDVTTANESNSFIVFGGGALGINSGATVTSLIEVSDGGSVTVSSGASVDQVIVGSSGIMFMNNTADDTVIDGGFVNVGGGAEFAAVVVDGGTEELFGGDAIGATVEQFGSQTVFTGSVARGTTVDSGGVQIVFDGIASNTVVNFEGDLILSSGVLHGGLSVNAQINDGGLEFVGSQALDELAVIRFNGGMIVEALGDSFGATILSAGFLTVESGGAAAVTSVFSGGLLTVDSGGVAETPWSSAAASSGFSGS